MPESPATTTHLEPRWLRAVALGAAAAVAAFGAVGLTLAIAGVYRPWLAFLLGAVAWVGLLALARPILVAPGSTARSAHGAGGIAIVFVGAIALWHAAHASQHVLINRDGGAYANAGRWIAREGSLRVLPAVGPFAHESGLTFASNAMYQNHDGSLSFQFAHLLPAVLAEARGLGGDRLMFATPGLLAGIALLAFFIAAWRFLRNPYVALAALVTFAFVMPEVSFSRDTYSELPTQILLFSALWIFADRHALRRPRVALVAGVLLGLLQATRIDAMAVLIGLPPLFAITWILADARNRRSVAASAAACAIGVVPGLVLGFTDLSLRAGTYLHDLRGDVRQLVAAMVASTVVSLVAVAVALLIARTRVRVPRADFAGGLVAGLVVVGGFGAWFVRPHLQHMRGRTTMPLIGGLQAAEHATVDPVRTYGERSIVWMSWYLGPVTLIAAIVGAALLARSLLRGQTRFALAGLALLGPTSALYLWRPSAVPDQLWVTRRYLFSAFPLLTLLAFALVAALARGAPRRVPRALPVAVAIAIGAGAVAYPISTVAPLRNMTEQRGDLGIIKDACGILGAHALVVVLQSREGSWNGSIPQSLRGWCGTSVAVLATDDRSARSQLARLATAASASGDTLWVVAGEPQTVTTVLPAAHIVSTPVAVSPYFLERTLLRRPSHLIGTQFSLTLARVPSG